MEAIFRGPWTYPTRDLAPLRARRRRVAQRRGGSACVAAAWPPVTASGPCSCDRGPRTAMMVAAHASLGLLFASAVATVLSLDVADLHRRTAFGGIFLVLAFVAVLAIVFLIATELRDDHPARDRATYRRG